MASEPTGTLVLKDTRGNYFLVPLSVLEQGRVPEERTTELEQLVDRNGVQGTATGDGHLPFAPLTFAGMFVADDVSGFAKAGGGTLADFLSLVFAKAASDHLRDAATMAHRVERT
jgi:hypothetical protein